MDVAAKSVPVWPHGALKAVTEFARRSMPWPARSKTCCVRRAPQKRWPPRVVADAQLAVEDGQRPGQDSNLGPADEK